MKTREILSALVAIPTPSAVSNRPLLDWVTRFVENHGWHVDPFLYTDETGISKGNLIAQPPGVALDEPIDLAFVCHTDTVPFSETWRDALTVRCSADGSVLQGCGTCDVKGALACFLAAVDRASKVGKAPKIALILTADEEIGCKGLERLLASTDLRIRSAIVSEPTSLCPGIAGKGYGLARVTVSGVEAHSAYPEEGVSAISLAARFITSLNSSSALETHSEPEVDPLEVPFDPPRTTFNVGTIQGGSAKNVVAGECSFLVEWRPVPADPPTATLTRLEALAAALTHQEPRTRIAINVLRAEPGFASKVVGQLQRRLALLDVDRKVVGRKPMGISFSSEASRLARIVEEVIVIGPGDMHTAHSDRECVPLAEMEEWTATLHNLFFGD